MTQDMVLNKKYSKITVLMLLLLMAGGKVMAQDSGVRVHGNVYGGGNLADVKVNTEVNISTGQVNGNVYGGGKLADVGTHTDQSSPSVGNYDWKDQDGANMNANTADSKMTGVSKVTITGGTIGIEDPAKPEDHGNVYGGGEGAATTFECEKAMVYRTKVSINTSGTVKGNVYGGGQVSRVEENTVVTIGTASGSDEPTIEGSVFAAGAGVVTHGYSALVRGTSTVTVQGKAQVWKNVYGGGEKASVGRYKVKTPANEEDKDVPKTLPYGMPAKLISGGTSTVIIQNSAAIGTKNVPTTGHVYGAGQGLEPKDYDYQTKEQYAAIEGNNEEDYVQDDHQPKRMVTGNTWEYFTTKAKYLQFVETLALSADTDVTIAGGTVRGSVFGGSESGFVYHDTDVNIQNGTINGSAFGGGRGLETYAEAGRVRGNTQIVISDGKIEGNVYGGGNLGDVGTINKSDANYNYVWKNSTVNGNVDAEGNDNTPGNNNITDTNTNTGICKVTISGGTIGLASTDKPKEHGNVFGAGKGREDTWWCEKAMVFATDVSVTAGTVNGTIYGGGEVGRVEDDAKVTIGGGANGPTIASNVFGAGAGIETHGYSALLRGNTDVIVQGNVLIGGNVYGGGEIATVGKFWVTGVDYPDVLNAPPAPTDLPDGMPYAWRDGGTCTVTVKGDAEIQGDVFGAGMGKEPERFDTQIVNVTDPNDPEKTINVEYYITKTASEVGDIDKRMPRRMVNYEPYNDTTKKGFKDEDKNITWVPFDDDDNPTIVWEYFDTPEKYHTFLQTLAIISSPIVTVGDTNNSETKVNGSVYGGSESGFVLNNTSVRIQGGKIGTETEEGNVFGGGKGLENFAEAGKVKGNTTVTISAGTIKGNVYGGGRLGDVGTITKPADYNYTWKQTDGTTANVIEYNKNATDTNTGICNVTISGGEIGISGTVSPDHGNVYGAGRGSSETWWCEKAMAFATDVNISAGTVYGNVYGGGQIGRVGDDTKVVIGVDNPSEDTPAPDIKGDVFGAGAGLETHGYSALVRGNALVTVQGTALIGGSVYGGGETASVGKFTVIGGLPKHPDSGGYCTVNIKDNAKIGTSGTDQDHNVFGACKGVTPAFDSSDLTKNRSFQTESNRPKYENGTVKEENTYWNYVTTYPEGYVGTKFVWVYYRTKSEYLDFLKTLALTSHPHVTIGGTWTTDGTTETITQSGTPSVYGSVYGGGERGLTLGNVDVDIVGGTVEKDVYGGGALADTNAGNWDADGFTEVTGLTVDESVVTGLYTLSGTTYTKISEENAKAVSGVTYYRKGKWADASLMTAKYTTTVDLTGGTIKGDAYGGGLGQRNGFNTATEDTEATVWGDINVNLGSSSGSTATSFWITYDNAGTNEKPVNVVKSGRVFGCNNLLGSPQGNVTVEVWTTVDGKDSDGNTITKTEEGNKSSTTVSDHSYRLAAVYGGGNLAPYTTEGKKTHVIIHGCDDTSIETVYGGGNAAPVPETDVDINSCYEIGSVFGGGNGKDKYTTDGGTTWSINPGANINGHANTMIYGGTVHEAYGGSNEKGTIYGDVTIDVGANVSGETCTLDVGKLVGAGKNADVNGSLKIIMGCKPNEKIPLVFGGADNANVNGNVELTVTSGNFGTVVGGNNAGGAIRGHIILNIEETTCIPLKIDNLYLCGYNAAYSQYGYYVMTEETEAENGTGTGASTEQAILTDAGKIQLLPRESATDTHKAVKEYTYDESGAVSWTVYSGEGNDKCEYDAPVLNVTSCTSIGEVFGGGYGTTATVYGNPVVNINMIPGAHADKIDRDGVAGADDTDGNLLGAIGDVYGGGDAAAVYGNTTVNIGTETTVQLHESISNEGVYTMSGDKTVSGAYITGNVYGGGKLADVGKYHEEEDPVVKDRMNNVIDITGNTNVNICAKLNTTSGEWESVAMGTAGVFIGGSVYGGGKGTNTTDASDVDFYCAKAMVLGNKDNNNGGTFVRIGNGTVGTIKNGALKSGTGNVYGGGEISRVEQNTSVTIGFGEGVETGTPSSAPDIKGTVFGAGAGLRTHGYSALVRGHSFVTIEGNTKIEQSVYGGGELATVGRYNVVNGVAEANISGGACTVVIGGYAEIGPDNMKMNNSTTTGKPDDYGHVFGAGMGTQPYDGFEDSEAPWSILPTTTATYTKYSELGANAEDAAYIKYIKTLALATNTEVTIKDHAFVKGSVYGGSENGFVQQDTHVTIKDNCQIGCGKNTTSRHPSEVWGENYTVPAGTDLECDSWTYDANDPAPYDKYATYLNNGEGGDGKYYYDADFTKSAQGGAHIAKDGHTFFGNVLGGGSGYYPYKPGRWFEDAGAVYGNTIVDIIGGHILSNVYGGNEMTNVGKYSKDDDGNPILLSGGLSTITMLGGTVGVPRTEAQMQNHPVTCNVFGAGMGEPRSFYKAWTKVGNTQVNISGTARIYGSTYGGGETGDVVENTEVNVCAVYDDTNNKYVASKGEGTPTIGGNVFGGGKGSNNLFTCEKAMVGIVDKGVTGTGTEGDPYVPQDGGTTVRIYNGTVKGNVYGGGEIARVERNTAVTIGEQGNTTLTPTIQGSVFAAGAGIETHGYSALVRGTSSVTVQGKAQVWHNVYGGGEKASVGRYYVATTTADTETYHVRIGMPCYLKAGGTSTVRVQGNATIGKDDIENSGHIYGAGQGVDPHEKTYTYSGDDKPKRMSFGNVWDSFDNETAYLQYIESLAISAATDVTIGGGTVKGSVFGGSESGFVYHNTDVKIQGGTVNGDAFGGGRGLPSFAEAGRVGWNTNLAVSGGTVKGNVYGGGNLGDVGTINKSDQTNHNYVWKNTDSNGNNMDPDNNNTAENNSITGTNKNTGICTVTISGGMIGVDNPADATKQGNVFGASHGSDKTYWCEKATVFATNVTITDGIVKGNVYGGGEIGRVEDDTKVTIGTGLTGGESGNDNHPTITGNVFGAGAGEETHGYSALVRGNCITTVQGTAKVGKNVYGGGEKATAGKYWISKFVPEPGNPAPEGMPDGMPYKTRGGGKCYVTVKDNAQIGPNGGATETDGHLFGAGKGVTPAYCYDPANTGTKENWSKRMTTYNASTHVSGEGGGEGTTWDYYPEDSRFVWEYFTTEAKYLEFLQTLALATETHVTVQGNATVMGTVYGGSDSGFVQDDTEVNILDQSKIGKEESHSHSNIFGGGKGHETFHEAGMVKGNTTVNAFGGEIYGSVYGGGAKSKVVGSTNVNIGQPAE